MEPARATLAPLAGGAVWLAGDDVPEVLVIGEGIESSASTGVLLGLPAWAALSGGNLARVSLPAAVRDVVIADDVSELTDEQLGDEIRRLERDMSEDESASGDESAAL